MRRTIGLLLGLSLAANLVFGALWLLPQSFTSAQSGSQYFPETKHYIKGQFLK